MILIYGYEIDKDLLASTNRPRDSSYLTSTEDIKDVKSGRQLFKS